MKSQRQKTIVVLEQVIIEEVQMNNVKDSFIKNMYYMKRQIS